MIFDFDGTLANSLPWFIGIMDEIGERFGGRKIDVAELPRLRKLGPGQILTELGLPLWKLPVMVNYVRERMSGSAEAIPLFEGIEEVLVQLVEKGAMIAVVSSNSEKNVRTVLGPEIAGLIRAYECGASIFGKATRFRRVLQRLGCTAAEGISIGDEIRDIDAAEEVGLATGAVAWGYADAEALRARGAGIIFEKPREILLL